jgi:hypothetical protein
LDDNWSHDWLQITSTISTRCNFTTKSGGIWDLQAGLLLILDKNRHLGGLAVEQSLALLPSGHGGLDPKALAANFDRRLRVRE